MQLIAHVTTV